MAGFRYVETPNGTVLVPDDQLGGYGLEQPDLGTQMVPGDLGAPALPPESPAPPVAFAPMAPDAVSSADPIPHQLDYEEAARPQSLPGMPAAAPAGADQGAPAGMPIGQQTRSGGPQGQIGGADQGAAALPDSAGSAPAAAPPTDLSSLSYGDIVARQQGDLAAQGAAEQRVGEGEAKALEATAAAMEQRNAAIAQREAASEQAAKQEAAQVAEKAKAWDAKNAEYMNTRVVRRGISTGELIGVALAGLGSAMKGQGDKNPALDLVMNKIQQHVDDQWRAKDDLGKQAGMLKGSVDFAREMASDAQAARTAAIGMEAQRWARDIEATAAKMAPGMRRDQVAAQAAALQAKGTEYLVAGKERQDVLDHQARQLAQQERESRRSAGVAYARLAYEKEKDGRDFAANMMQLEEQRAQRMATATTAADKEAAAREVPDLKMGDGGQYQARDEKSASDVAQRFAATQSVVNLTNDLQAMRRKYGNQYAARQSPEWQKMIATSAAIGNSIRTAEQMGTLDNGSIAQMNKMMGGADSRDGITDAMLGNLWKGDTAAGLEQLKTNTTSKFNDYAKAMRHPRGPAYVEWKGTALSGDAPIATKNEEEVKKFVDPANKTPDEIRAAARPGAVARSFQVLGDAPTNKQKAAEVKAQAASDVGTGGILTKDQAKTLDKWQSTATSGDAKKAGEARKSLVAAATSAYAKGRNALGDQALLKLAVIGDEESIAEVSAQLTAGAKSESEIERRLAPVKFARQQAELLSRPAVTSFKDSPLIRGGGR